MGTGVFRYDREQLIGSLAARCAQARDIHAGQRPHFALLRGWPQGDALGGTVRVLVGAGVIEQLTSRPEINAVGGLTMGADPIVGATLALAGEAGLGHLRGFLVRKETKTHGTGNLIEGPLEPGSTVAILDDVATTGGSSLQAALAVEAIGCKVAVVIVVLDRLEGAAAAFAARGLPFHPLLTIRDLGVEPLPVVA